MDWSATSTTTSTARCTACSATGPPASTRERSGWCSPTPCCRMRRFPSRLRRGSRLNGTVCAGTVRSAVLSASAPGSSSPGSSVLAGEARMGGRRGGDDRRGSRERRAPGPTHPVLGLIKAGMIMSWERQVCYWYAAMELRLDRRLRQFGFVLRPISPPIDYQGPCRAHWGFLPEVFAHMRERPAGGMASFDRERGDLARGTG